MVKASAKSIAKKKSLQRFKNSSLPSRDVKREVVEAHPIMVPRATIALLQNRRAGACGSCSNQKGFAFKK